MPYREVTCPSDFSVCVDANAVTLSGATPTGGEYSGTGVTEGSFDPSVAGAGEHTITYTYTDSETNCTNSCTFTITVDALPEVTCPSDFSVCVDANAVTLSGATPTGGEYSGTGVTEGSFDPSVAGAGEHTITYTYTDSETNCTNSCTFTITVDALPEVTCPSDFSVCVDANAVTLSGATPTGGEYSGTGVTEGSFDPSVAGAGEHTITYTYTDSETNCTNSCTFTITVDALPEVTCPSDFSVCVDANAVTLSGATPMGGEYSGTGVTEGSFDPSVAGVGEHTITYTYTDSETNCTNSCTFTITVDALPVVTCPSDFSVCVDANAVTLSGATPMGGEYSGTGVTEGSFDPSVAGVGEHTITYTYTDSETNCTNSCTFTITVDALPVVTCPSDFSVCVDANAVTLSGATPMGGEYSGTGVTEGSFDPSVAGVGEHTITYTYTDSETNCTNSCTFTITVDALPVVTCPSDFSVCVDANAVTLSGATPMGGEYSGTGVTEGSFDPSVAGVGEHTITYTYTDSETNCTNSCTFTITVNALPVVTCPSDFSVCVDANAVTLSGATPTGGEYSGTGVTEGSFDPSVAGAGEHTITYTYTDSETNCTNSCTFTITVNALPVVTCPSDFSVCVDANAVTLSGATPMGGEYSGTGVTEGSFDPSVAGVGEHTITYTYTDSETNCTNSCTFTITVDALPVVTCPSDFSVCVDANAVTLSGATPMGGEYSGTGVTEGSFDPSVAGVGEHTITYTYTDSETNCTNSCTFTITVNALPVVTCPSDFSVCVDANAVTLSGGTPMGGEYSGTGVSEGSFDPSVAGVGEHTITYTYTDSETNCTNSCTFTITVNALPVVTCPSDFSVCVDANAVTLSGGTPMGGEYSGTGVSEGSFDPSVAGVGEHTITYTYIDSETNCTNSCTFTITVHDSPTITGELSVCIDETTQLTGSGTPASEGAWTSDDEEIATVNETGLVTGVSDGMVMITYTDENGCTATVEVMVIVGELCGACVTTRVVEASELAGMHDNVFYASELIISNGVITVGENIEFRSDETELLQGFEVELGAEFTIFNDPCVPVENLTKDQYRGLMQLLELKKKGQEKK